MKQGWISIYRALQDNDLWQNKPFARGQAWIDLLLLANSKDNKLFFNGKNITVKRGSFITSILKLSRRWGWSRGKVKRFLIVLESLHMLKHQTDTKSTSITISKYSSYQDTKIKNRQRTNTKRTSNGHQTDTNNNSNNSNNSIVYSTSIGGVCVEGNDQKYYLYQNTRPPKNKIYKTNDEIIQNGKVENHNSIIRMMEFVSELNNVSKLNQQLSYKDADYLLEKYEKKMLNEVLKEMENKKDLPEKYVSTRWTIDSWCRMREKKNGK